MSDASQESVGPDGDRASAEDDAAESDTRAEIDLLRAENRRLRERVREARRSRYRRTAGWLAVVGAVAAAAAAAFPTVRDTLVVLAAIGFFGAVLTRLLTPERFVAADTAETVSRSWARSSAEMATQLGLSDTRVYVPVSGTPAARLFVPLHDEFELPDPEALDAPFVADVPAAQRGLSLAPAGAYLFVEFERTLAGPMGDSPETLADQIADALVSSFELAERVDRDVESGRVSVTIHGGAYGGMDGLDDPLASFVGVTLAQGLDTPVRTEVVDREDDRVVTCRWEASDGSD